jgi:hypothetical protein
MRVKKETLLRLLAFIADIATIAGLVYILIERYR